MIELWNICTICPLDYWLDSFLICVNYSIGIFISSLMFLCLKCLLTVGEIQYCVYYVGLWFICYASQSFKCSWFSVFFGLMTFFPLVFKLYNQNPRIPILLNWFIEIVLACSFVVWEQFSALTSLAPLSGIEVENLFSLGYLSFHWFLEGELKPTNLEDYFSTVFHSGY